MIEKSVAIFYFFGLQVYIIIQLPAQKKKVYVIQLITNRMVNLSHGFNVLRASNYMNRNFSFMSEY